MSYNNIALTAKIGSNSTTSSFTLIGFAKPKIISVSLTPNTPTTSNSYIYNSNTNKLIV
ncbi:hypothetical protein IKS57_00550 [bacterium]|nr:hypothetical protein [bacterium]